MSALDALHGLIAGWLSFETDASREERDAEARKPNGARRPIPPGFVEGSEAYEAARLIGWPLIEMKPTGVQGDIFEAPLLRRFVPDPDWHDEIPFAFGGEEPDDAHTDLEDAGTCIAWSETHVMFWCPRGVCSIPRDRWQAGWRHCEGC